MLRTFVLAVIALIPATAAAQNQTVEGAHRFLAMLVDNPGVRTSAYFPKDSIKQVTRHSEDKSKYSISVEQVVTVNEEVLQKQYRPVVRRIGKAGSCKASIEDLQFSAEDTTLTSHSSQAAQWLKTKGWFRETTLQDPRVVLAPPHHIDWGQVKIARGTSGTSVSAGQPHPAFGNIFITYETSDPDLLDRIEYAMKFLQMSCDPTSNTGF
jgi:hypothetical protein